MNFEDIKKIVNQEGKVVIIENGETYIVSKYKKRKDTIEEVNEIIETEKQEPIDIEDLPF